MNWQDIPGWFNAADVAAYRKLVAPVQGGTVVEVGSFAGRSAVAVGDLCRQSGTRFYCVDHWRGSPEMQPGVASASMEDVLRAAGWPDLYRGFLANVRRAGLADVITPLRLPSAEAAAAFGPASVDLVFIDAAHDYDSVAADIEAWRLAVKPGGVLAGHDYDGSWPGVVRAVDHRLPGAGHEGRVWSWRAP
jgi:predicted O-methyltransferase YrrM